MSKPDDSAIVRELNVMSSIIKQLECSDFAIRKNAILLLNTLMKDSPGDVQQSIMNVPMGVSRIVDLIQDDREFIRNDAVLMLSELSRGNVGLQQLLAYENTFQHLFSVIEQEPLDSIVVEDCLVIMLNLLKDNPGTQELFREESLIKNLTSLAGSFIVPSKEVQQQMAACTGNAIVDNVEWSSQKIANFIFVVQIIRIMVSSSGNLHPVGVHSHVTSVEETNRILTAQSVVLFKFLEDELQKIFRPYGEFVTSQQSQAEKIAEYKKTIEQQGVRIVDLSEQVKTLKLEVEELKSASLQVSQQDSVGKLDETVKQLETQLDYGWKSFEAQSAQLADALRHCEEKDARLKQLEQMMQVNSSC